VSQENGAEGTGTGRFTPADRMHTAAEFRHVLRHGKRGPQPEAVLFTARTRSVQDPQARRLGVTASRRVGGAVIRNRQKRRVREWFRASRARLAAGSDLVVLLRPAARKASTRRLWSVLDRALEESQR